MKGLKSAVLAILALGAATLSACASAQAALNGASLEASQEYHLGSGDELKITVFGEPTLSGNFVVDGQGVISMSLIGEMVVKDKTIREVQRAVETKLKTGYVRDPQVSAEMIKGRPYYISGEVNRAGEYPFTPGLTVMNAIAAAGDFTYRANKKKIMVRSAGSTQEQEVELTPVTQVRPGDTIRIKERMF